MQKRYDNNCKTTTIWLLWAVNITILCNIDILPIPTWESMYVWKWSAESIRIHPVPGDLSMLRETTSEVL